MKPQNAIKLDPSAVTVRLGLCAAALAGTAASVPDADAAVVTFNTPISVPATTAGVYINLLTGATGTSAGAVPGWDFNPYLAGGGAQLGFYWAAGAGGVASGTTYQDLPPGTTISSASTFTNVILGTTGSPFLTTGTHILGLRFTDENTSAIDYGYLTMTTNAGTPGGFPATVVSWSFDNTGAAITIPSVPEPTTASLLTVAALAVGALGLREWRRKRAA